MTADSQDVCVFRESPARYWLVACIFLLLGFGFLVLAVTEAKRGAENWTIIAAVAAGIVGVTMGGFAATHAERTTLTVDARCRILRLQGWLPWRRRQQEWRFDQIATVEPEVWDDADGGRVYRPNLVLRNGERVPLTSHWLKDNERVMHICSEARRLIERRGPARELG